MDFPRIYEAIREMINDWVRETPHAIAIMRKSGFLFGGAQASELPGARAVLSVSPIKAGDTGTPVPTGTHAYPVKPSVWL